MPRILVNLTDNSRKRVFVDDDFRRLATLGDVVYFDPQKDEAGAFGALLARSDVMLTCWGSRKLTPQDWPGRESPLLVAHSAGSVRGIVPKEVLARGVRLTQSASAIAFAVAQYTVGLMIMALRQAVARSAALRDGARCEGAFPCQDLEGLTVGLVGLSQVGRRVPPLLQPFGCHLLAYDPYWKREDAEGLGVSLMADLDELIARSDVLSLHAPVTPETQNLLDAHRIALLKPGATFVNTARAQLVDQNALFARALAGEIQAYLDVTTPEPLPPTHEGWSSPNIFITPHIAGPTKQSMRRIARHALDEIERFVNGRPLASEVTPERYDILA
jgi:phosphoglycerate dehydrogenase-like enzyme